MSGYYLLQNGEFANNKSYSKGFPVGSIKRLDKYAQGALSTLYICFALKEDADVTSDYLVQYFNSPAWYEAVNEVCAEGARKLDAYCEDVGQTATMAIERILDDYLTKYMADKENASEGENKADTAK